MSTSYSEWHTLTIGFDGEDEHGNQLLDQTLDHPDSCPPPASPDTEWSMYRCWIDEMVGEFTNWPSLIGLPTEPGVYRIRAWATPPGWAGSNPIDPDSGLEVDEDWQPEGLP